MSISISKTIKAPQELVNAPDKTGSLQYHTSPLKWIRNRRLDKAEKMLLETSISVTDICYSINFENIAYFSKVFKLRFELAPSEYRLKFKPQENEVKL